MFQTRIGEEQPPSSINLVIVSHHTLFGSLNLPVASHFFPAHHRRRAEMKIIFEVLGMIVLAVAWVLFLAWAGAQAAKALGWI